MDQAMSPRKDFYQFAVGSWIKKNPVPADKSRWGAFNELSDFNAERLHRLVERTARRRGARLPLAAREVRDFYLSATDSAQRNRLRYAPLAPDLERIDAARSVDDLVPLLADFHNKGIPALFSTRVNPDKKRSDVYALYLVQDGLSLPDREYYLAPGFGPQRKAFHAHLVRSFTLAGDPLPLARREASTILRLETALARASRSRTELRDQLKNYNRMSPAKLRSRVPAIQWKAYFSRRGVKRLRYVIVGQPDYFRAVEKLLRQRRVAEWKTYFRWHLLRTSGPYLHRQAEDEDFRFFRRTLLGQQHPEPAWKRAIQAADLAIGEALGQLFVAEFYPPEAARRMKQLVADVREVFADRLRHLEWMSPATRRRALRKFSRFTAKIGHPKHPRDDSSLRIDPRDYLGNIWRALEFESRRKVARLGRPVDPDEWRMTAPMVNAYYDSTQNEIVFPAGILQPPFFDARLDDAVNYGGIGLVIGHEITHGYDDQGRRSDERGNLHDWWTPADAREFQRRAKKVVAEYDEFEALPGAHVNGKLTLGENIADLGGLSIAYEALQRRLKRDPESRKTIDGLTPEQRFFISYAQIWRNTVKEPEVRRLLTVDTHSPGRFRVIGAVVNSGPFFKAFGISPGDPMYRPEHRRVRIW
jgi:putative endopeptidase